MNANLKNNIVHKHQSKEERTQSKHLEMEMNQFDEQMKLQKKFDNVSLSFMSIHIDKQMVASQQ